MHSHSVISTTCTIGTSDRNFKNDLPPLFRIALLTREVSDLSLESVSSISRSNSSSMLQSGRMTRLDGKCLPTLSKINNPPVTSYAHNKNLINRQNFDL